MPLTIPILTRSNGDDAPVNWSLLKKEVIARLDMRREYEQLGVKCVAGSANEKGFIPCYAVGRDADDPDTRPSAAINVRAGFYLDKGMSDKGVDFWRFAQEHGRFGSFIETFRHYADKVGVEVGKIVRTDRGFIVEADYDFREFDGAVKYQVQRLRMPDGEKKFRQRAWDGDRFIGHSGCMDGVPPLPYRLPELLAADEAEVVLWPEGEAKVDLLRERGFVATCAHMGAHNFKSTVPLFVHRLPPRDYAVLVDNDPAGRKYAAQVAGALHAHLAAIDPAWLVKVVSLPDLPVGGDVVDWFQLGGTAEELHELVAAAPAWEPGSVPEEPPPPEITDEEAEALIVTLEDVAKVVSEDLWVWKGWIPSEALTLLAAQAGAGKTLLMMDLHRRALHGLPWPDGEPMNLPPNRRALWIVADNHFKQMLKVADEFGIPRRMVAVNAFDKAEPTTGTSLMTAADLDNLERNIRLVRPYWVVIDTMGNTSDYKSQDTVDAKRQYKPLQEIALRCCVPIICITHLNATATVLGRRAVEKARTVVMFSEPDRENQPHRRKMWVDKSFDEKPSALGVTVTVNGYEYDNSPPEEPDRGGWSPSGGGKDRPAPKLGECVKWLEDLLGAGTQAVTELIDLAAEKGFGKGTLWRAKDKLDIGEFEIGNRKHWQLNFPD